jgi:hypothetical protein
LEREQTRKIAQIELTEYRNILIEIIDKEEEMNISRDKDPARIALSDAQLDAFSLPTTSYLEYQFEKRNSALTIEEAAKVESVYKNGLKIPMEEHKGYVYLYYGVLKI